MALATSAGTAAYGARFAGSGFYRAAQGLTVSTLGLGSYLGRMDAAADACYEEAVAEALRGGINFIDTSLNYRHQRSERNIGAGLRASGAAREGVVLCTKAGYLTPDAVPLDKIRAEDVVENMHCMTPDFLEDQLHRSLANLGVDGVDVFYLHNPETQLDHASDFYARVGAAFARLETLADAGLLQFYGVATWSGFRQAAGGLSLAKLAAAAFELRGDHHRFRFIQAPFNLGMTEVLSLRDAGGRNLLDRAGALGITMVASAAILQSRLSRDLPPVIAERLRGLATDAQRAIQFARSTPGVTTALVGMGRAEHVRENLGIAKVGPAEPGEFLDLFP